ncbi:MAG: hypothetical protein LBU32_29760 [Clostridiales bacterium]|jgi:molybdenum cofactor synthesis domain-containing protein|nr:hypothetical protein [Clostridiales bacterium]
MPRGRGIRRIITVMNYTAAVITVSDSCSAGVREDSAGAAVVRFLEENSWDASYTCIIPDDADAITSNIIKVSDELGVNLCLTVGGTGFSQRDVTPEATKSAIEREVPGIPEYMRMKSMESTPFGMLSRAVAGLRKHTLIINLPGSKEAALECLSSVLPGLSHAVETLLSKGSSHQMNPLAESLNSSRVIAVCVGKAAGDKKHETPAIFLLEGEGAEGDVHDPEHQVSILAIEAVRKMQKETPITLKPGAFSENILTEGLETAEIGDKLRIGNSVVEVTSIGRPCIEECIITKSVGECLATIDNIYAKVVIPGTVSRDDPVIPIRNARDSGERKIS